MVEGVAVFAEIAGIVALAIAETALLVLVASIRPWRYVFSQSFRSSIEVELATRSKSYRVLYFAWGTLVLIASGVVIAYLWAYFRKGL